MVVSRSVVALDARTLRASRPNFRWKPIENVLAYSLELVGVSFNRFRRARHFFFTTLRCPGMLLVLRNPSRSYLSVQRIRLRLPGDP